MNRTPAKCPQCRLRFTPEERGIRIHPACVDAWYEAHRQKQAKKAEAKRKKDVAQDKRETKAKLRAMASIPDLIKEADEAFQKWVKARDQAAGYPCISSGRPLQWGTVYTHAGHFRTKGAASALRYHPDNCHAQSSHDNKWKSGNVSEYRIRLIERIGLERVEALEAMNATVKWTREGLIETKALYVQKLKELKAKNG